MAWACQRTGDCCRLTPEVVMTDAERAEIERAAPHVPLQFRPHPKPGFTALVAGPCPLLRPGKPATCLVWAVRPYNCRRWGCFRADVRVPLAPGSLTLQALGARIAADRRIRREFARLQRKAQPWALTHGWEQEVT